MNANENIPELAAILARLENVRDSIPVRFEARDRASDVLDRLRKYILSSRLHASTHEEVCDCREWEGDEA